MTIYKTKFTNNLYNVLIEILTLNQYDQYISRDALYIFFDDETLDFDDGVFWTDNEDIIDENVTTETISEKEFLRVAYNSTKIPAFKPALSALNEPTAKDSVNTLAITLVERTKNYDEMLVCKASDILKQLTNKVEYLKVTTNYNSNYVSLWFFDRMLFLLTAQDNKLYLTKHVKNFKIAACHTSEYVEDFITKIIEAL